MRPRQGGGRSLACPIDCEQWCLAELLVEDELVIMSNVVRLARAVLVERAHAG